MKILRAHPLSKPEDGPISQYANRWLSIPISAMLLKTDATPNQVTLFIFALTVPILAAGMFGRIIVVGVLIQLASVLDGVDGEIARARGLETDLGALLDTVSDYWVDSVGITALGLALIGTSTLPVVLVLLLVVLTVAVRLISQFVVKTVPDPRAHIIRDCRDDVNILVFIGAVLAGLLSPWYLVGILLLVDLWRLDNMVYQLYQAAKSKE